MQYSEYDKVMDVSIIHSKASIQYFVTKYKKSILHNTTNTIF